MTIIKRDAVVNFTQQQMFELVNNIEDYTHFLPWCSESRIISQSDTEIEAILQINWSGIHKSFTTRNTLFPYEKIKLSLVNGPFKRLEGYWNFIPLSEDMCKVELELAFELAGNLFDFVFQPIFNKIANSLVDLFCKRAVEIYG